MTNDAPDLDHGPLLAAGSRLLSDRWGGPIELELLDAIVEDRGYRHTVLRSRVHGRSSPPTVVLKTSNHKKRGFARETAALRFLGGLEQAAPIVPELLAVDPVAEVLVLEDLGTGPRLREVLRGSDPQAAEKVLVDLMHALARLHAGTLGREEEFKRILEASGEGSWIDHAAPRLPEDLDRFGSRAALAGVAPDPRLETEIGDIAGILDAPDFRSITSGDVAPVNVIPAPAGVRIVDFEVAGFRNGAVDACFPRIRHLATTDSNLLPAEVQDRLTAAYREELFTCGAPVTEQVLERSLLAASAAWMASICRLLEKALEKDRMMILSTRRQRVLAALDAYDALVTRQGPAPWPGLHDTVLRLREELRSRWPDTPVMPVFPAFSR